MVEILGDQQNFYNNNGMYHYYNHNLDENSTVIELGGNIGAWVDEMINRFNPNFYIIEPLEHYYNLLCNKYSGKRVQLLQVAIGPEKRTGVIYHNDVGSSRHVETGTAEQVEFVTPEWLLEQWNLPHVDLLQINIEGDEYDLLEHMIATGVVSKFRSIQVQFHIVGSDPVGRRTNIQQGLAAAGFTQKYNFDFVWEAWTQK